MAAEQGRRERNKLDKQTRIFAAAAELFARDGYDGVTTQQIAERAGVTNGTLFRYASTKAELLLMVMNGEFAARITEGRAAVAALGPAAQSQSHLQPRSEMRPEAQQEVRQDGSSAAESAERIMALIAPIARGSRDPHESTSRYQRELLFGEPTERYRAEGLALTATLQGEIADLLRAAGLADLTGHASPADAAALAARAISNVLHLEIARAALEGASADALTASIAGQVDLISSGYLRSRHPESDASLTESPMKED